MITAFYQAPARFTPVSFALLTQINYADKIDLRPQVIPAIVELAALNESSDQQKETNTALLQHMRSDKAAVRLAGVQCQRALVDRLGHDWLALLPEMLPLISELQEDDDERIEDETLKWIAMIEETLGESLTPMLQ